MNHNNIILGKQSYEFVIDQNNPFDFLQLYSFDHPKRS